MEFALSLRNDISVVNENNYDMYLSDYSHYIMSSSSLRDLVINKDYDNTILELKPAFFVDFTQKKFLSLYPELLPFENYVPDNWHGAYEDFTCYISEEDRYWILNRVNLIDKIFEDEKKFFKGE